MSAAIRRHRQVLSQCNRPPRAQDTHCVKASRDKQILFCPRNHGFQQTDGIQGERIGGCYIEPASGRTESDRQRSESSFRSGCHERARRPVASSKYEQDIDAAYDGPYGSVEPLMQPVQALQVLHEGGACQASCTVVCQRATSGSSGCRGVITNLQKLSFYSGFSTVQPDEAWLSLIPSAMAISLTGHFLEDIALPRPSDCRAGCARLQ